MKYRIKEEGGWFYPQYRSFIRWGECRWWNGSHHVYSFRTMEEARRVIDGIEGERQRKAMDAATIKYHPYP